ncbi:MAG: SNF2-related protein [Deferrisomatales bacterium]|nr:SNF2-related protein [Deferrisomatales bacterium]
MKLDWTQPRQILAAFERAALREERFLGVSLCREGAVRVTEERALPGRLVLQGLVGRRKAEGSPHRVVATILPTRLDARCDCPSLSWPCRHVLAVVRQWADEDRPSGSRPGDWRSLLRALAPPRSHPVAVPGQEVVAHWVELRRGERASWSLVLSWRLHRVTTRGLGRGRILTYQSLRQTPPPCLTREDERVVAAVAPAETVPRPAGGGAVEIGEARADGVLRALARAREVHWASDRAPASVSVRPVGLTVGLEHRAGGLELAPGWREMDGSPWEPTAARVVSSRPPWVEDAGELRPVLGPDDPEALGWLAEHPPLVPEEDVPAFLGSFVAELEGRGIGVEAGDVGGRPLLVRETACPRLYLTEEKGALVAVLRFAYGDVEVPAENPDPVVPVGAGAQRTLLRRDLEAEFHCALRLRKLGFRVADAGRFEIEGETALDFVRGDLEALSREWQVFGRDALRRHRVTRAAQGLRVRLFAAEDWLELELEAEADGEPIPSRELFRALRRGGGYVRLGDGGHAVLPREWAERLGGALEGLDPRGRRLPLHLAPLVRQALEAADGWEVEGRPAWERLTAALWPGAVPTEAPDAELPPPPGFRGTLRPYQVDGYRWMRRLGRLGLGCVLADDMGLGKTVQALAVLLAETDEGRGPNLVVAPTSVVPNWEAEAARFAPGLRVVRYTGAERKERAELLEDSDLVVTSYAVLRRDVTLLAAVAWNYVILDEAQAIKNAATQTARAAARLGGRCRLALTGTPLENHLGELWSHFQFLAPGLLGTERGFTRTFTQPILQGDESARDTLRQRIRPFLLRRLKSEVARELPEKVEHVLWCEMGEEQERLYRELLRASRERVLGEVRERGLDRARFSILEALLRLRQACSFPSTLPGGVGEGVPSAKFDLLRGFVAEVVEEGHRLLVFSQFVKVLGFLRRWFEEAGISHLYMDGHTRDREERVRRFQEDPSVKAFLVSLKAGGTGLNLTGADYVILADPWWNPAVEIQAADRAHRIGQTRKVFAYKLITKGSVEEKVLALQERKRRLTDDLVRSERAWGGTLTEADVEALFAP